MYKLVKKILDRAKENNVDVGVAYDYIGNDEGYSEELKKAHDFILDNYEVITSLRVKNRNTDIKVICDMYENGNIDGMKNYIKSLK